MVPELEGADGAMIMDDTEWVRLFARTCHLPQPLTMFDCAWCDDILWEARRRGREAARRAQEELDKAKDA